MSTQDVTVKRESLRKRLVDNRLLLLIFLPGLLHLLIFKYAPMFGLIIIFQDYNPFRGFLDSDWVGFKHFIDVFDEEPIPTNHPLLGCEHVVLTPHCADMTPEGVDLLNGGAVDNVINYLKGTPHNIVS